MGGLKDDVGNRCCEFELCLSCCCELRWRDDAADDDDDDDDDESENEKKDIS